MLRQNHAHSTARRNTLWSKQSLQSARKVQCQIEAATHSVKVKHGLTLCALNSCNSAMEKGSRMTPEWKDIWRATMKDFKRNSQEVMHMTKPLKSLPCSKASHTGPSWLHLLCPSAVTTFQLTSNGRNKSSGQSFNNK